MLSFFKEQGFKIEDYPNSFKNYATEISLPIYPQLQDEQVDLIIDSVVNAYSEIKKQLVEK